MSGFGGLWKQQNNPACTITKVSDRLILQSQSLHNVEVGHHAEEEANVDCQM